MGKLLVEDLSSQWGSAVVVGAILCLTIVLVALLRLIASRGKAKITETSAGGRGTHVAAGWRLVVEKATPPAIVFIWIWGASAIAAILVAQYANAKQANVISQWLGWLEHVANIVTFFWLVFRLLDVVKVVLDGWAKRSTSKWDDVIAAITVRALRLLAPLIGVILVVPTLNIPPQYHEFFREGVSVLLAGAVGFILYELVATGEGAVVAQFRLDEGDNLAQRKIQTQVKVLKRFAVALIALITIASMLMVFDSVRHLAQSLLASAGVAGIVIGFAAQKSLATVVAGVQVAFAQPIRIDDVVIVEGEWGRVEEITMTYVVVAIWDLRRMVLPISYFIEKPFQNWTRDNASLLGTVFLYLDYTVPVAAIREELDRILAASKFWDKKVKGVQVTDSKERTLELRVLVSAADSSKTFDLRCEVREKLVDFLQRNYPGSLPRVRLETQQSRQSHSPLAPSHEEALMV